MFRMPKQEYAVQFEELAVKRVKSGQGIGAAAKELGLVEQTLRNWVKAAKAGKLDAPGGQGDHAGGDGAVADAGRERALADGA